MALRQRRETGSRAHRQGKHDLLSIICAQVVGAGQPPGDQILAVRLQQLVFNVSLAVDAVPHDCQVPSVLHVGELWGDFLQGLRVAHPRSMNNERHAGDRL